MDQTEFKLLNWRGGNPNAERMCADILVSQDYESVDPQCPLGGPDGIKDVVCEKAGWKYIAAAYFPTSNKTFRSIKPKFVGDLKGVKKNKANGIIFMTNQKLTPSHKTELRKIAKKAKAKCIIYDNEAIRSLLDSSLGFPIRLQYLKIKLSKADQLSFFTKQSNRLPALLDLQSKEIIKLLSQKIDECCNNQIKSEELENLYSRFDRTVASIEMLNQSKSDKRKLNFPKAISISTRNLEIETLKFIHKIMLYESGSNKLGEFRTYQVWIGNRNSSIEKATYVPPKPEEVTDLITQLLAGWRENYQKVANSNKTKIIKAIAKFHNEFLKVHPFLDGNGRVARFVLNQQVSELLGVEKHIIIEDNPSYFEALTQAQKGKIISLEKLITQAIYGSEIPDE